MEQCHPQDKSKMTLSLLVIPHARLKELLVLAVGHIHADIPPDALRMPHLAQHAPIGARDSLDGMG